MDTPTSYDMEPRAVALLTCWVLCSLVSAQQHIDCTQSSPCSCITSDGKTIDLSPLDSGDGTAKWSYQNSDSGDGHYYSYNPCSAFTEGSCSGVAACQDSQYVLGTQDTAKFVNDQNNGLEIQYTAPTGDGNTRTTHVQLLCGPNVDATFDVSGEDPTFEYHMSVTSKYCCPQGDGPHVEVTVSISVGTVLCIIFIIIVPMYLVGGVLYNKFRNGSTGVEMLPNSAFWVGLPALIMDGALFLFHGIKRICSSYESS